MKMYLYVILGLPSFALLTAVPETKHTTHMKDHKKPLQCYCSGICNPRDVGKKPGDKPEIDPETGICFCQQWDKDKFTELKEDGMSCADKEQGKTPQEINGDHSFCEKHAKPAQAHKHHQPVKTHPRKHFVEQEPAPMPEENQVYEDGQEHYTADNGPVGNVIEDTGEAVTDVAHGIANIL